MTILQCQQDDLVYQLVVKVRHTELLQTALGFVLVARRQVFLEQVVDVLHGRLQRAACAMDAPDLEVGRGAGGNHVRVLTVCEGGKRERESKRKKKRKSGCSACAAFCTCDVERKDETR